MIHKKEDKVHSPIATRLEGTPFTPEGSGRIVFCAWKREHTPGPPNKYVAKELQRSGSGTL